MQYSMVMFFFLVFDRKYPFSANLVQKVKIISLSWNLVGRLIRICRIQRYCSLFWFFSGNTLFGHIWSKISKLSIEAKKFSVVVPIVPVFEWKYPFWANLDQKVKIVSLMLNWLASIVFSYPTFIKNSIIKFLRWHILRFDISYKRGKPFFPVSWSY